MTTMDDIRNQLDPINRGAAIALLGAEEAHPGHEGEYALYSFSLDGQYATYAVMVSNVAVYTTEIDITDDALLGTVSL